MKIGNSHVQFITKAFRSNNPLYGVEPKEVNYWAIYDTGAKSVDRLPVNTPKIIARAELLELCRQGHYSLKAYPRQTNKAQPFIAKYDKLKFIGSSVDEISVIDKTTGEVLLMQHEGKVTYKPQHVSKYMVNRLKYLAQIAIENNNFEEYVVL